MSGSLSDRLSPRVLIFLGTFISALSNILIFISGSSYIYIIIFWAVNGIAQSLVWSPVLRIAGEYFTLKEKNKFGFDISTTVPLGTLASYGVSLVTLLILPWKYVFLTCGIIVFAVSFYWLNGTKQILKDYEKIQNPHIENDSSQFGKNKSVSSLPLKSLIKILISSGVLTVLISIAIQGALKDSVTQWIPTFLNSKYKVTTGFSLLLTMLLPIINVTGAYFAKAINKKIKNEFLTSAVFFGISAIFLMILFTVKSAGAIISVICMAGVTNCMFAINVMLITMVPLKFSEYGRTGTVGGFLNAFAYIGCGIINLGSGALLEKSGSQWNSLILMWLILAAAAFLITAACSITWKKFTKGK
ncbi:MAG: MFS transporter [Clostridiales bacterium]|nr:MFS transporter [Clostridiales bacterium]